MKKFIFFFLIIALCVTGCGHSKDKNEVTETETETEIIKIDADEIVQKWYDSVMQKFNYPYQFIDVIRLSDAKELLKNFRETKFDFRAFHKDDKYVFFSIKDINEVYAYGILMWYNESWRYGYDEADDVLKQIENYKCKACEGKGYLSVPEDDYKRCETCDGFGVISDIP